VFAVSAAGLPGALAAPAAAQAALVSAATAAAGTASAQPGLPTTPRGLNASGAPPLLTGLGQLPAAPPGAAPAPLVAAQTTTQSPAALSPNSTAPPSVLSYSGYQLTSGLNPSLAAGQLPTPLNTPAVNALFEVGGNASEATTLAPANTGNVPVVPLGVMLSLALADDELMLSANRTR